MIIYLLMYTSRDNNYAGTTYMCTDSDEHLCMYERFLMIPKLIDIPLVELCKRVRYSDGYCIVEVNPYTKDTTNHMLHDFISRYEETIEAKFYAALCECDHSTGEGGMSDWKAWYSLDGEDYDLKWNEEGLPIIPREHLAKFIMDREE